MSKISFKINGKEYEVDGKYGPDVSLNEFIRNVADLRGTKAMCHEGGCGACVVAARMVQPPTNEVRLLAVNSCLVSVLSCHGWEVTTVEGLGNRTIGYHDIQKRLASFNGTQCGYCTPGWIMNMYSLYESKDKKLSSLEVENSFASQMCRCTGYRPIADALKSFATDADNRLLQKVADIEDLEFFKQCGVKCKKKCSHKKKITDDFICNEENEDSNWCVLEKIVNKMIVIDCGEHKWFSVYTLDDAFKAISESPDYKLIAGNTGQGVYHVKSYPKNVIDIFNVSEIKGYYLDVNLVLGAGMPLTEMMELFLQLSSNNENFRYLKQLYDHMDLVAHIPVRNIGTIAGNLFLKHANNEFQSDVFLIFEVVGAMVTIANSVNSKNIITLPEFLKTDMKGKIMLNVMLPPLQHYLFKTYKIMPRSQNAHAVVNAGFFFKFKKNANVLEKVTIVYGSISSKFIHASETEKKLIGKDPFTNTNLQMALKSLEDEIVAEEAPPEPSALYRKMLAVALYYKAILWMSPDDKIDPKFRSGGEAIKRSTSKGNQTFDTDKTIWPLNQPLPKLEGLSQCSGEAIYANDLPKQIDEVFAAFVTADVIPGSVINGFDTTEALKTPGVIAFYTAKDIPGKNNFCPTYIPLLIEEEEILCKKVVKFNGQPAGIIVADREKTANKAARLVKIKYLTVSKDKPLITIDEVLNSPHKKERVTTDVTVPSSDTGKSTKSIVYGSINVEHQYHYYMEPQTCVVKPTEEGMEVYSSTQWLDAVNNAVAECLNMSSNKINVYVRRLGGAYGGKISRASLIACAASIVSYLQGKTCRMILSVQTNFRIIGKRLPTQCQFEAGVNSKGKIQYLKLKYYQDNGCSRNETITPVTVLHLKNCYDIKRWYIEGNSVATDTPGNTWCRAPGSTEGIAIAEYIMERIAFTIGKDPIEVRLNNMITEENPIPELIEILKTDCDYDVRQEAVRNFNNQNRWRKRALKLLPMTYDLVYFGNFNALISVYHADGSVVLTHGGIEMGQGINTKVAQTCAYILGIPLNKVSVKPSSSFTSPNAAPTGGSIGSEVVSFATTKACEILLKRLEPIREKLENPTWEELIAKAFVEGVDLQASYMYSAKDGLKPYDIYGVVALEIEVDILTGNHEILRVDILEDTGRSLNPEVDVGQIEGAFVMGLGYWTSEQIKFNFKTGELLTDRTWTYKPPGIKDIPADFRVYFRRNGSNKNGVLQSKATGEPAFCMATVVIHALREAVRSARLDAGYPDQWVDIKTPCTVENIFQAVGHRIEHFKLK